MYNGWANIVVGGFHSGTTGNDGDANNNIVNIYGGTVRVLVYGGDTHSGNANQNTITIDGTGVNIASSVIGGYSQNISSYGSITNGTANENTVTIKNGTISGTVYGGYALGNYGEASNNTIDISGGTITGNIYGGYSNRIASENIVNISGGTFSGNIYGGGGSSTVTNNIINIPGSPDLTSAILYGYNNSSSSHSGNTLNFYSTGLTAKNIENFDIINFYLPESTVNGDTVLTLSETSTDISGATIKAGVVGNANLKSGDVVTLLTNAGTITDTGTTYGTLTEGVSLEYNLTVSKSGDNSIIATIGSVTDSDNNNGSNDTNNNNNSGGSASSGDTGGKLNDRVDILTKPFNFVTPEPPPIPEPNFDFEQNGLDSFFDTDNKGWEIFANYGGGPMRYKVNNGHIDTTNQNVDLGAARNVGNMANKMTIAPVIDYQNTNYDSYLNDGTRGRGNSRYTGGGFVLRNLNRNGFYYEGSFRAGRNKVDFASEDLDTTGMFGTVTYDASQTILNGHLKLGKYIRFDKNNLLDIYGFYYHTHQGGTSADLSSGEHYNFSSANAGRARIGYRLTTRTSRISQVYIGLAYQYEHNSGVKATYKGYSTSGESHNGSSGMLEIGWVIKPLKENPWAVNINATGWIGNQRGVKAFAKIQKSF